MSSDVYAKQMKCRQSSNLYWSGLSLREVLDELNDLIESYGEGAELIIQEGYSSPNVFVEYYTIETEAERDRRVELLRGEKNARRRQYEELKKEFENE